MKILVLGGAGDMGSEAVRDLVKFSTAENIIIADRNVKGAKKLANSLGDKRVAVEQVDATSHRDLVRVMQGKQVAAGALGPFYRFEKPIVEASLEAGVDYVSLCDDHDAAEAVLALDQIAKEKGCRIMTGMGWTPGLSNMLARRGFEEMDNVESIRVYWAAGAGDSEGLAVILHTIHIFNGKVTSYQKGNHITVKAGSEKEAVNFPSPLGTVNTFHLGHPEPVTLPRYLNGLQTVTLKGGLAENYLNALARAVAFLGLSNNRYTKQFMGRLLKVLMHVFPTDRKRNYSGIRVDIQGTREGKPLTVSYAAVDHMRRLTGIPLSIGTILMAENQIKRYGVFSPEADEAVYSDLFLKELNRREIEVNRQEL